MFLSRTFSSLLTWWKAAPMRASFAIVLISLLLLDQLFPPPIPKDVAGLVVVARDGSPLRSWPDGDGVWRFPVTSHQVSPKYIEALLTYEDRWFYWHLGINPVSMVRAAWQWIAHGKVISGGSTLSMQVARSLEPVPRSMAGKLRQTMRAVQLEMRFSKEEILNLYLNHAPMGGIVEGVEMASRTYLGKSARHLSSAEAALLVVLPQAPSRLRPDRFPKLAQAARDKVLQRMADLGRWTQEEVDDARIENVGANPPKLEWIAPLAAERLHQQAKRKKTKQGVEAIIVKSSIDRDLQLLVERMLSDRVSQLPRFVSMSALVMDSKTLEVLAYAGSADFQDTRRFNHVDMVRGIRSPGSTLKPFLYAMALDDGLIHSASLMADTPQSFSGYDPGNFQANFSGPVSIADALQRSLNVTAVDLLDRVGPYRFSARLAGAGLQLRLPKDSKPNLSIILGGAGTNLEELVGAYRALAMGGMAGKPRLSADEPKKESRIMSAGAAFIIRSILEGGGHPDQPFVEDRNNETKLAWKTGTSYGFRDAWAVGVSGQYTLGVWVGRPDGTPNPGFFGANIAAPLLKQMASALPRTGALHFKQPKEVSSAQICWPLGIDVNKTSPEHCHVQHSAWILNETIPPTLPDRLRARSLVESIWIDKKTHLRTMPSCHADAVMMEVAKWPSLLELWLTESQKEKIGITAWSPNCYQRNAIGSLKLMGINEGSRLRAAPGLNHVEVSVNVIGGAGLHYWLLNGKQIGQASGKKNQVFRINESGKQSITVIDSKGHYDNVQFTVDEK